MSAADEPPVFQTSDLTRERDLWTIWKQTRRIKDSPFNVKSTLIISAALCLYALYSAEPTPTLAQHVRDWSDMGLNLATGLLGFLIAGFTIFCTLLKPALFLEMAKRTDRATGLSYLKSTLFNFMKAFAVFLVFITVCILVKLFAGAGGGVSTLISHLPTYADESKRYLAEIGIVFVGTFFFYLVVMVKSFIYNVYHAIMTSLRWEAEYPEGLK